MLGAIIILLVVVGAVGLFATVLYRYLRDGQ